MIISSTATFNKGTGLSLSTTNVLLGSTPTITDPGAGEVAKNITNIDHSLTFTSGTLNVDFEVSFGAQINIGYVGISGHDAALPAQATIELYNDTTLVDSVVIKRNHNIMFTFANQTFQDLIVKFITVPISYTTTVSYIAAGEYITLTQGEQSGYSRSWLLRGLTQRTSTNLQSAPTATTQRSMPLKASLSLPNFSTIDSQNLWQDFIDFSFTQPFFIKELDDKPESSYLCFDPRHKINAHPQTRSLNTMTMNFNAYNGL